MKSFFKKFSKDIFENYWSPKNAFNQSLLFWTKASLTIILEIFFKIFKVSKNIFYDIFPKEIYFFKSSASRPSSRSWHFCLLCTLRLSWLSYHINLHGFTLSYMVFWNFSNFIEFIGFLEWLYDQIISVIRMLTHLIIHMIRRSSHDPCCHVIFLSALEMLSPEAFFSCSLSLLT